MSWLGNAWGDVTHWVNRLPGAAAINQTGSNISNDIGSFLKQQAIPGTIGPGKPKGVTIGEGASNIGSGIGNLLPGGGGDPRAPTTTPAQQIASLSFGQEYGTGVAGMAKQLAQELQGMPAKDAQKLMSQIAGTPLATDIANILSGQPATGAPAATSYGFDPLSLGKVFSQTLAPWLAQQQTLSNQGMSSLANQMQSALAGASPAMRQAYSTAIPSLEAAQRQSNLGTTQAVAVAPEWDAMIAQLTQATAAAKAAQAAAQAEPYWAATTGTGTIPGTPGTTSTSGQSQQILNAIAAGR